MRLRIFIGFLFILLQGGLACAVTITSTVDGDWGATGTWSLGRKPTCGDTVVIPPGRIVTVNAQENLVPCGTPVIVYVQGTLQFTNGNKIDFPCGSMVYIAAGGVVKKVTSGGGNSTLISICGTVEWNAGDGQLNGPDTLGNPVNLPVTWLLIQAGMKGKMVEMNWSTGVEINNNYFDVMRSADGVTYKAIGRVNGNGNSTNVNYYSFLDTEPEGGISYYKLVQVDFDGKENPSDIVAVYNPTGGLEIDEVHLSPNPVGDNAIVIFNSRQKNLTTIEIKNATGQLCLVQSFDAERGVNTLALDKINQLAKGVYSMVIKAENGSSRPVGLIKK